MALCFVHSTAGYLAYEVGRPPGRHRPGLLAAAVVLANAPDFDFLPGLLIGQPGVFHRRVTHTIAALAVVAALGWLLARVRRLDGWSPGRLAGWAGGTYGSHLLLDFFTADAKPPYGAQFLWPLSDAFFLSPVTVLREVIIDPTGRMAFFRSLLVPETLGVWAGELAILVTTVTVVHLVRAVLGPEPAAVPEIADGA